MNSIGYPANLLNYPWSLTDREFQFCMMCIKTGNIPDPDKLHWSSLSGNEAIARKVVQDTLVKKMKAYLEKGLLTIGGKAVEVIFKIKGSTWGGFALDFAREFLMDRLKDLKKQDMMSRYHIDEVRRIHLAHKGQSTYKQITNLT